jgi:Family of unknown function (DUF6152)
MTHRYMFFLVALTSLLIGRQAVAHHAFSPVYDERRTVTIKGTVTEFRLVNPHAMMSVDVVDQTGKHVIWTVEMAGLLSLSRHGWTPRTVSAGEPITVTGNPTHTGSPRIFFTRIVLADGTERLGPGPGDVGAIDEQRRERARARAQQK